MSDKESIEDVKKIYKILKKYDCRDSAVAKKIIALNQTHGYFKSEFGIKLVERLSLISAGENDNCECLLCHNKEADNGIFCRFCYNSLGKIIDNVKDNDGDGNADSEKWITCPECGMKHISLQAFSCPKCGFTFKRKNTEIKPAYIVLIVLIILLIVNSILFAVFLIQRNNINYELKNDEVNSIQLNIVQPPQVVIKNSELDYYIDSFNNDLLYNVTYKSDSKCTVKCDDINVDYTTPGKYKVDVYVTDTQGNKSTDYFYLNVKYTDLTEDESAAVKMLKEVIDTLYVPDSFNVTSIDFYKYDRDSNPDYYYMYVKFTANTQGGKSGSSSAQVQLSNSVDIMSDFGYLTFVTSDEYDNYRKVSRLSTEKIVWYALNE